MAVSYQVRVTLVQRLFYTLSLQLHVTITRVDRMNSLSFIGRVEGSSSNGRNDDEEEEEEDKD